MLVPALLALALLLATRLGKVRLFQLGLRPWSAWSTNEKSYFLQVLVLANVVFLLLLIARPSRGTPSELALGLTQVFLPYLFFGFYQELVYRGLLQLGLVRRWGPVLGVIAANVLYTFGPLHQEPLRLSGIRRRADVRGDLRRRAVLRGPVPPLR